eukprot:PhM_4_TR13154/c0_g2_i1/m.24884
MVHLVVNALASIAQILTAVSFGAVAAHRAQLSSEVLHQLANITTLVFTPCLIFSSVVGSVTIDVLSSSWAIPLSAFVFVCLGGVLNKIVLSYVAPEKYVAVSVMTATFCNPMSLPLSLLRALASGSDYVENNLDLAYSLAFIFNLCWSPLFWCVGPIIIENEKSKMKRLEMTHNGHGNAAATPGCAISTSVSMERFPMDLNDSAPTSTATNTMAIMGEQQRDQEESKEQQEEESESSSPARNSNVTNNNNINENNDLPPIIMTLPVMMSEVAGASDNTTGNSNNNDGKTSAHQQHQRKTWKQRLIKRVGPSLNAPFIVCIVSFILALISPVQEQFRDKDGGLNFIFGAVRIVGEAAVPVTLIMLGANLYQTRKKTTDDRLPKRVPLTVIVLRLIVGPSIGLLLWYLLEVAGVSVDKVTALVMMIEAASPMAINNGLLFALHRYRMCEVASITLYTYLACVPTLCGWLMLTLWLLGL